MIDLPHALSVARKAADASCAVLLTHRETVLKKGADSLNVRTKKHATDFVSIVDEEAQEAVIGILHKEFPDHRFLAEEEGADVLGDATSPYRWIIDPLDGTNNFLRGNTMFGSMVGLECDGEPLLGVIAMPVEGHVFAGGKGLGVTHNGKAIAGLRTAPSLRESVVSVNIFQQKLQHDDGTYWVQLPNAYVVNYGCAAREIADLFLGCGDGVAYRGVGHWDVAAGNAMVKELGGRVRCEYLVPDNQRKGVRAVLSSAPIFDELSRFVFVQ